MSEAPSPEEFKRMREEASRRAILENKKESIADLAVDPQPPGAFETGSPSSPEGQKVFRATEKASLTPPNAPSAAALMAEEALAIPVEGAIVRAAKPAIDAAKPLVEAAKPYFDSVVEGLTSMVKKTPKVADAAPARPMAVKTADEPFVSLKAADDGSDPPILEHEIEKTGTIGPAIQAIVKHATNPAAARIAARIEPFVRDVPVYLAKDVNDVLSERLGEAYGAYSPSGHRISLRSQLADADYEDILKEMKRGEIRGGDVSALQEMLRDYEHLRFHGTDAETVLHEALHAATVRRFSDGRLGKNFGTELYKASQEIVDLFDEVSNQFDLENEFVLKQFGHAMSNEDEFIAYGLSNREFQEYLMTIKVPGSNQSLWSKFVALVGKLLNIAPEDQTALGELLRTTDALLDAPLSELRDSVYDTRHK